MKSIHVALWKIRSMTHRREVVLSVNTVVIMIPLFPVYDKDPSLPKHGPVFEHAQDEKSHGISLSKDMHVANMWSTSLPWPRWPSWSQVHLTVTNLHGACPLWRHTQSSHIEETGLFPLALHDTGILSWAFP